MVYGRRHVVGRQFNNPEDGAMPFGLNTDAAKRAVDTARRPRGQLSTLS